MKIVVVGIGYVGFSQALLLSKTHEVIALDINQSRIDMMNQRVSPFLDQDIALFLSHEKLNLNAYLIDENHYKNQTLAIIATPTHYDPELNFFDTSIVESVIKDILSVNQNIIIVIKSTVPVGFTKRMKRAYNYPHIIFSPEFLREGKSLYDLLYPSRIIVGDQGEYGQLFANLMKNCSKNNDVRILLTGSREAEAIKLFSNTYLAMRIAFFNELDSYAEKRGMDTRKIIEGVSMDPRIGNFYNNPSFGYGGYCLPKDTKQLLSNYDQIPQNLIKAIVDANQTRKDHIADMIYHLEPNIVGIYRLAMKRDSDNFRESAVLSIIRRLQKYHIHVIIYEPTISVKQIEDSKIIENFGQFVEMSDVIVANRLHDELLPYLDKVYTRDIFLRD